jgi:hypothetical protein
MDFMFARNFPTLTYVEFDLTYTEITTMFSGVETLWSTLSSEDAEKKRALCYNYLVGWQLADMYPDKVIGIQANGGMPLTSKSIGGTSVSFKDFATQDGLKMLESNVFGLKALSMINGCPERMGIYG